MGEEGTPNTTFTLSSIHTFQRSAPGYRSNGSKALTQCPHKEDDMAEYLNSFHRIPNRIEILPFAPTP